MAKKQFEITIVGDTNDGDYVTSITKISEEDLKLIKPLIKAIKDFKPYKGTANSGYTSEHRHNYPHGDGEYIPREDLGEKPPREIYNTFSEEVFDIFEDILPYGEHGIHSIKSIEVMPYVKKTKLL